MTQNEIVDYLSANSLNVNVCVGEIEDTNGKDYIFLDYIDDVLIGSDDRGCYQTHIQITIATRDFENRKTLVSYVKEKFNVSVAYEKSDEFEYYIARCECGVIMNGEQSN